MDVEKLIQQVARLAAALRGKDLPLYLVGGAVRDLALGRPVHDLDFTGTGDLRPLAAALADQLRAGFYPLDEVRGTYRVVADHGRAVLDFATLRGEDLRADLAGRDFTINAVAVDVRDPETWIDPLGGLEDLRAGRLRACSPTSISDDPVRSLRAVRLAVTYGLVIDPPTLDWVRQGGDELARVSAERVRDEIWRMLELPSASECLLRLDDLGILAGVLPELDELHGVSQSAPHVYPVWEHTLAGLDSLSVLWDVLVIGNSNGVNPALARAWEHLGRFSSHLRAHFAAAPVPGRSLRGLLAFAALYHDSAKPRTRTLEPDGRTRFFDHEERGARLASRRARALALSLDEIERIGKIVAGHMRVHQFALSGTPSSRAIYRYFRSTGPAGIDISLFSLADTLATFGDTLSAARWQAEVEICELLWRSYWERSAQVVSPPRLLDGGQIMRLLNLKPGPQIGRLLESLREAQVEGEVQTVEEAEEFLRRIAPDLV